MSGSPRTLATYRNVEECLERYAGRGKGTFEKFLGLAELLEEDHFSYLLIGSLPIPLLIKKYNKETFGEEISSIDNIDLVVNSNPSYILPSIASRYGNKVAMSKNYLTKKSRLGTNGNLTMKDGNVVYHFKIKNIPDVSMFFERIGHVPIYDSDFENSDLIEINGQRIHMPRLGLFLASRLNPESIKEKRAYKSALVVENVKDSELLDIAKDTRSVFQEMIRCYSNVFKPEHFQEAKEISERIAKDRHLKKFSEYIRIAFDLTFPSVPENNTNSPNTWTSKLICEVETGIPGIDRPTLDDIKGVGRLPENSLKCEVDFKETDPDKIAGMLKRYREERG